MRNRKTEEHMQTVLDGIANRARISKCLIRADTELAKVQNEEPGARKPHAGICAGGAR